MKTSASWRTVRNKMPFVLAIVLITVAFLSIASDFFRPNLNDGMAANPSSVPDTQPLFQFAVLEDPTGELSLSDIMQPQHQLGFIPQTDPQLKYGQSDSAFWVRLTPRQPGLVLSVFNPTVQHLSVFEQGQVTSLGWGDPLRNRSELYFYPVIQLRSAQTIYLRLNSAYIQSYALRVETVADSNRGRLYYLMSLSILYGILLAILITHLIYYLRNRERIQIAFVLFMLSNLIYQFSLMGIFRFLPDPWGNILISRVGSLGLIMTITIALFAQYSLQQTSVAKALPALTLISVSAGVIGVFAGLSGVSRSFAQLSSLIGLSLMLVIETVILIAARRHYRQIKTFFWGGL